MRLKTFLCVVVFGLLCGTVQLQAQKIKDSVAFALGIQIGESLKQSGMINEIDLPSLITALEEIKSGKMRIGKAESDSIIRAYFTFRHEKIKTANTKKGEDFLARVKTESGVVALPSGLLYKIVREGNGVKPQGTDEVEVHYRGTLIDGKEFDSSYGRGETAKFILNKVIKGWTEGLQHVNEGGKVMLYVPSDLAYGEASPSPIIEPNSVLVFEIELLKVKQPSKPMSFPAMDMNKLK